MLVWISAGCWRYTVPWPLDFGVYFRMPVLGLLGFPLFQLLKRALHGGVLWQN
ncbi:MAG: hypothetical protein SWK90_13640 [Chloroflexota bacterium]|nr:hypothetical protein [Chloroflexota bacterium]